MWALYQKYVKIEQHETNIEYEYEISEGQKRNEMERKKNKL